MTTDDNTFAKAQSVDVANIPVIDIAPLLATTSPSFECLSKAAAEIHQAAIDIGFFYVRGHGIDPSVISTALSAAETFFALPESVKEAVRVNQQQRGWMPSGMAKLEGAKTHDLKEVFFYGSEVSADNPELLAGVPLVAMNQWPNSKDIDLSSVIRPYHQSMCRVGEAVLAAIAVGFGQSADFFNSRYHNPLARGQLVYYPQSASTDEAAERYGVAPHTDFGVVTLLFQDDSGGLQVKTRRGQWIEAPPIPDTLVVNTGDLLQRWTNDRFQSTLHRVINRSGRRRYSMPVFFDPGSTAVIDPRDLGVSDSDAHYDAITTGEHIQSRNRRNFTQYKR